MDKEQLKQLIVAFLAINPQPSDDQVHMLATAIGMDHEPFEAVMYEMLAESNEVNAELSEEQKVLDGDYDPNTTSTDDLVLNDGAPEGTSSQEQVQDSTLNDGVAADDVGIDVSGDQSALLDDGAVTRNLASVKVHAAARLAKTEIKATSFTDPDKWEEALAKKYPDYDTGVDRRDPDDRNIIAYKDDSREEQVGYFKFEGDPDESVGYGKGEVY